MLRITTHERDERSIVLRLEGKLLTPWLEEFVRCVDGAFANQKSLHLDLSALTYADANGTTSLRNLIRQGAMIDACSGFLAALLHVEKP
jgi:hypothetical protein